MKTTQPLGNPKYNDSINCLDIDCNEVVSLACNEKDCRFIDIKKNGETCLTFLAASLIVCTKNDDSDCAPCLVKDYRTANNGEPYVNLFGVTNNCSGKYADYQNFSIFPVNKTAQELEAEIISFICACLNPAQPAPPVVGYNIQNGVEFLTQNTWGTGFKPIYGVQIEWLENDFTLTPPILFPPDMDFLVGYELYIEGLSRWVKPQIELAVQPLAGGTIEIKAFAIDNIVPQVSNFGGRNRLILNYTKI